MSRTLRFISASKRHLMDHYKEIHNGPREGCFIHQSHRFESCWQWNNHDMSDEWGMGINFYPFIPGGDKWGMNGWDGDIIHPPFTVLSIRAGGSGTAPVVRVPQAGCKARMKADIIVFNPLCPWPIHLRRIAACRCPRGRLLQIFRTTLGMGCQKAMMYVLSSLSTA